MTDTIKKNITFYKSVYYDDIEFDIYKVINKDKIKYFNNKDIYYSSPYGSYIILNDNQNEKIISLLDLNIYLIENYNLY